MARRLGEAGLDVAGVLSPDALADAVRRGFDADGEGRRTAEGDRRSGAGGRGLADPWRSPPRWPGPMAMLPEWGRIRTDATWHATYWIAEWPRTDVAADFLGPLLLVSDVRRSVAVVMEPVAAVAGRPPHRTGAHGRHRRRRATTSRRVPGHGPTTARRGGARPTRRGTGRRARVVPFLRLRHRERFDSDALEEACGRMEQVAGQAGLELRRCYGDQAMAFTCTLPLGRGLA